MFRPGVLLLLAVVALSSFARSRKLGASICKNGTVSISVPSEYFFGLEVTNSGKEAFAYVPHDYTEIPVECTLSGNNPKGGSMILTLEGSDGASERLQQSADPVLSGRIVSGDQEDVELTCAVVGGGGQQERRFCTVQVIRTRYLATLPDVWE